MKKTLLHVICDSIRHNTINYTAVYDADGETVREDYADRSKMPAAVIDCATKGAYIGSSWTNNADGKITQHDYFKA